MKNTSDNKGTTSRTSGSHKPSPKTPQEVVLFDLDRTLVSGDTASLWMRYEFERGGIARSRLMQVAWWKLQYTFGAVDAQHVATSALRWFAGREVSDLKRTCVESFKQSVRPRISQEARATVKQWQERGAMMVIVTAASRFVATHVADDLEIPDLLCTELEVEDGKLTGNTTGGLCYGEGKVARAKSFLESRGKALEDAAVYTDSITDLPLLDACGTPVCINPDPRLRRLAKKRGWSIERWG